MKRAHNFKDKTGLRFGRLKVTKMAGKTGDHKINWHVRCDCGGVTIVPGSNLTQGATQSCGCLQRERTSKANFKHGDAQSVLNNKWFRMKRRCLNPKDKRYAAYGGRGITICEEWMDYVNFQQWAKDSGYEDGLSIERINNDGNYEPSNCRWIPMIEQSKNTRKSHKVTFKGRTQILADWAREIGIGQSTLQIRLKTMSAKEAFTKPLAPEKGRFTKGHKYHVK